MSTREMLESKQKSTVRALLPFPPLGSALKELESGLEGVQAAPAGLVLRTGTFGRAVGMGDVRTGLKQM